MLCNGDLRACGLVVGFGTLAMAIIRGDLFSADTTPPIVYPAMFAVAGFYAIVAVVVMLLRKRME